MSEQGVGDHYAWWRLKLAGGNPPIHESEPQCGYFKVRDGRGLNRKKHPVQRPFRAAAIWLDDSGTYRAEMAGSEVPIDRAWPWFARRVITYEQYQSWHENGTWEPQI